MEQVIEGRIKHAVKGFVDELLEKLPEDGDFVANPEILTEQQTALLGALGVLLYFWPDRETALGTQISIQVGVVPQTICYCPNPNPPPKLIQCQCH